MMGRTQFILGGRPVMRLNFSVTQRRATAQSSTFVFWEQYAARFEGATVDVGATDHGVTKRVQELHPDLEKRAYIKKCDACPESSCLR
jgi:hypothetical protein